MVGQTVQRTPMVARRARSTAVTSSSDLDLQRRVLNFLYARGVPGLDQLQVEAADGAVIIRGKLPSADARNLCLNCCRRVAGVIRLVDHLEI